MKSVLRVRKSGFTLIELLIVIIIIGILAGMMMLTMGGVMDRAEATKIINDLRAAQGAVLMYRLENNEWPVASNTLEDIDRFMVRKLSAVYPSTGTAAFVVSNDDLLVGFNIDSADSGIKSKLANDARSVGLYTNTGADYASGNLIYMHAK
jgi:general secretion pathway protein G